MASAKTLIDFAFGRIFPQLMAVSKIKGFGSECHAMAVEVVSLEEMIRDILKLISRPISKLYSAY